MFYHTHHIRMLCLLCLTLLHLICSEAAQRDVRLKQPDGKGGGNSFGRGGKSPPNIRVVYEASRSLCHSEGRAFQCMPPFTNVAEGAPVKATSTCGTAKKSENFCHDTLDARGRLDTRCDKCDSPEKYAPHHLTDRHQMTNETVWASSAVLPGETVNLTVSLGKRFEVYYISLQPHGVLPDSIALYKSADFGVTWQPWQYFSTDCYRAFRLPTSNEHNAQISAANIQEVLCVALKSPSFQESLVHPGVIAFSTTIGRPSNQPWSSSLIDWMTMTDLRVSLMRFSDQRDTIPHDASGLLLTPGILSPTKIFRIGDLDQSKYPAGTLGMSRNHFQSDEGPLRLSVENKPVHFAFSDLTIGGRCKCNGHANRCVQDLVVDQAATNRDSGRQSWGPLRCDCQHNTAGSDCERCAPGYLDRPWARATLESANECKPCHCGNHTKECIFSVKAFKQSGSRSGGVCLACRHNTEGPNCENCVAGFTRNPGVSAGHENACRGCDCNLHSSSCVFSQQIFLMSMKTSGGVCQDCQHNTVGRRCHQCTSGFHRDWTKPVSHEQACLECRCHPIGSLPNTPCDRKTGQCPCKPGVTGQLCNRCQDGFKQTSLQNQPCIRATEHFAYRRRDASSAVAMARTRPLPLSPQHLSSDSKCPPCKPNRKRIRFRKFCSLQAVFRGIIESQKVGSDKVRYEVRIQDTWRVDGAARHLLPSEASASLPAYPIWAEKKERLIPDNSGRQMHCPCPDIKTGGSYLFLTQSYQIPHGNRMELMLDARSIVLPWRKQWRRRLKKFAKRASDGRCSEVMGTKEEESETEMRRVHRMRNNPMTHHSPASEKQPRTHMGAANQGRNVLYNILSDKFHRSNSPVSEDTQGDQPSFTFYSPLNNGYYGQQKRKI